MESEFEKVDGELLVDERYTSKLLTLYHKSDLRTGLRICKA